MKRDVRQAVERVEDVACGFVGNAAPPQGFRIAPNDLRRVIDYTDWAEAELKRLRKALRRIRAVAKPQPLAQMARDTAKIVYEVETLARAALNPRSKR